MPNDIRHAAPAPSHVDDASVKRPSKSQIKRELKALVELGRRLVELPAATLADLPLPDVLREAIALAQRIHSREGRRRQIHYVGKLLRQTDARGLQLRLSGLDDHTRRQTHEMHRLEDLRDRLLAHDEALTELLQEHPGMDVQALRTHIREARREILKNDALTAGQAPERKHYRALFQMLKQTLAKDPDPS